MGEFPEHGFKGETIRERLSRGFNERAYGKDDVTGIRTATHYSNITVDGAYINTEIDCAIATKMPDGTFLVTTHHAEQRSHVSKRVMGMLSIDGSNSTSVTCTADEVLDVMDKLDVKMAKNAAYSTMLPDVHIVRMHDTVPLPVAQAIFAQPATRDQIEHQMEMLTWHPLVQKIKSEMNPG